MTKFIPTTTNIAILEFIALFYENIKFKYSSLKGIISN